jgi:hypothetical protein
MIEFRILDEPKQKFSTVLNNRRVTFQIWYSVTTQRWSMDLAIDGAPVLHGRKIVTGVDLLAAFSFGIGVIFALSEVRDSIPDRSGLPLGTVKLYHTTQEEIDASVVT